MHIEVPSSNEPLPSEWGKPLWYVMRLTALQANPALDDMGVARLVGFFEGLQTLLPCPECRGHYITHWASNPFTADMATNAASAISWVEELRGIVDARVAAETRAETAVRGFSVPKPPSTAYTRTLAVRSAVQTTRLNHAGHKPGCNCAAKKR